MEKKGGGYGARITNDERSAWIPKAYLNQQNDTATMLTEYGSSELEVVIGETVEGLTPESNWLLCTNSRG